MLCVCRKESSYWTVVTWIIIGRFPSGRLTPSDYCRSTRHLSRTADCCTVPSALYDMYCLVESDRVFMIRCSAVSSSVDADGIHLSTFLFPVPSVLWHCWLGQLTRKNPSPYDLYCVGGTLSLTQSIIFVPRYFLLHKLMSGAFLRLL